MFKFNKSVTISLFSHKVLSAKLFIYDKFSCLTTGRHFGLNRIREIILDKLNFKGKLFVTLMENFCLLLCVFTKIICLWKIRVINLIILNIKLITLDLIYKMNNSITSLHYRSARYIYKYININNRQVKQIIENYFANLISQQTIADNECAGPKRPAFLLNLGLTLRFEMISK
jgi:hypothetical protein